MIENNLPYILTFLLFSISIFGLISSKSYFKKLIFLGLMQASVIIFYILIAYVRNEKSPFTNFENLVNPLPHVLMLTAIVVGLAILSTGLALVIRLNESFGTIEEDEVHNLNESGGNK